MKNLLIALFALSILSCGSGDQLEKKKKELAEKKKELSTLKTAIEKLENELALLDTVKKVDEGVAVKVESIAKGEFKNPFRIQGLVESDRNVLDAAEMGGTITRVYVKDGQMVSKGQVIATLDGSTASSQIAELQKGLELAKTNFEKQESLWKQNIGSEMQYLQAKNRKESLEKSIATAQLQLGKFTLRAPISGVLDQLFKNEGEILSPGTPIARVVDASQIKIKADVSESYLNNIKIGDKVEVSYPSLNKTSVETVFSVGNYINPDNRTFSVYIIPSGNVRDLKPNLLAVITAYDFKKSDVISVPTNLIRNDGGGDYILTANESEKGNLRVTKTPIVVEEKFAGRSVIKSGLNIGDNIIIEGYQSVVAGDKIKVVK
jgi:membrane fusion protein (multidrug efflux system)